jgi:hypothetical protein
MKVIFWRDLFYRGLRAGCGTLGTLGESPYMIMLWGDRVLYV